MIRALFLDGPRAGEIQEMPQAGWVSVERVNTVRRGSAYVLGSDEIFARVHYRPRRVELLGQVVWVASCMPMAGSGASSIAYLLSDVAKDLLGIDTPAPTA